MTIQTVITTNLPHPKSRRFLKIHLEKFRVWRQRRRDLAELRGLSSGALRDLGIDRSEASSIVNTSKKDRRRNYHG